MVDNRWFTAILADKGMENSKNYPNFQLRFTGDHSVKNFYFISVTFRIDKI